MLFNKSDSNTKAGIGKHQPYNNSVIYSSPATWHRLCCKEEAPHQELRLRESIPHVDYNLSSMAGAATAGSKEPPS